MSRATSAIARAKSQQSGNNSPLGDALSQLAKAATGAVQAVSFTVSGAAVTTAATVFPELTPLLSAPQVTVPSFTKLRFTVTHSLNLNAVAAGEIRVAVRLTPVAPLPVVAVAFPPAAGGGASPGPGSPSTFLLLGANGSSPGMFTATSLPLAAGKYDIAVLWGVDNLANDAASVVPAQTLSLNVSQILA